MNTLKSLLWGLAGVLFLGAATGSAQSISIVSGNGQLSCMICPGFNPLIVQVKDSNGAPVANTSVTWTVATGNGLISAGFTSTTTLTDANGQASVNFYLPGGFATPGTFQYYSQSSVTASISTASVTFYETSLFVSSQYPNGPPFLISYGVSSPTQSQTLTGQVGQQSAIPVQATTGVPNVEIKLVNAQDNSQPAGVACASTAGQAPGTTLSDASGAALCNVIFTKSGSGSFNVSLGGLITFGPYNYSATGGAPCAIKLVSGNNQSANPGAALQNPLVAEVDDCAGNALDGIPVVWSVSPSGSVTLSNTTTTTANGGRVATNAALANAGGQSQITVAVAPGTQTANGGTVSASFTAMTNVVITGFQKVAGDNQAAIINTAFGSPLTVQVTAQPASGITVQFTVSPAGAVTLSSNSATTGADGKASVHVTAGPTAGPATVTALVGASFVTFNLTVQPPGPTNLKIWNGAGFQQNWISACSIAQITGTGIATGVQGVIAPPMYFGALPYTVMNVSVNFSGANAPIYSVANVSGQESVTVEVPCDLPVGASTVTVKVGVATGTFQVQVLPVAPGLFEGTMSDGVRRAVLVKPDGTFVDALTNPARKGERIRMYVTGIGPVTPAVPTNSPGIPDTESAIADLGSVVVGVNNGGVPVVSARYARDLIGVYEVAFDVPADVPAGNLNFVIAVYQNGNLVFSNPSTIPVQ